MYALWSVTIVSWLNLERPDPPRDREGEGHPEKPHGMVAEIALAQETPWRGGWWDLGKQKVGTAVTADPFLQGVLSQRMCYSLWTIWGLLQLWLYMVVNVTCRKSKGVWIERCWLSSAALLFTCRHNLGPWYSQTLSVLLETVLKATVKLKGATTVNLQHYLGHTSVNFLLFPFPFLLCQPMLVAGAGADSLHGILEVCWACPRAPFLLGWAGIVLGTWAFWDSDGSVGTHGSALRWTGTR